MKPGDLVSFVMPTRYRGSARRGILVKRTHLTYDPGYCRWDVLYKGRIENARQSNLRSVLGDT
jgi:hypothetical protein